jgi:hypothetical protein
VAVTVSSKPKNAASEQDRQLSTLFRNETKRINSLNSSAEAGAKTAAQQSSAVAQQSSAVAQQSSAVAQQTAAQNVTETATSKKQGALRSNKSSGTVQESQRDSSSGDDDDDGEIFISEIESKALYKEVVSFDRSRPQKLPEFPTDSKLLLKAQLMSTSLVRLVERNGVTIPVAKVDLDESTHLMLYGWLMVRDDDAKVLKCPLTDSVAVRQSQFGHCCPLLHMTTCYVNYNVFVAKEGLCHTTQYVKQGVDLVARPYDWTPQLEKHHAERFRSIAESQKKFELAIKLIKRISTSETNPTEERKKVHKDVETVLKAAADTDVRFDAWWRTTCRSSEFVNTWTYTEFVIFWVVQVVCGEREAFDAVVTVGQFMQFDLVPYPVSILAFTSARQKYAFNFSGDKSYLFQFSSKLTTYLEAGEKVGLFFIGNMYTEKLKSTDSPAVKSIKVRFANVGFDAEYYRPFPKKPADVRVVTTEAINCVATGAAFGGGGLLTSMLTYIVSNSRLARTSEQLVNLATSNNLSDTLTSALAGSNELDAQQVQASDAVTAGSAQPAVQEVGAGTGGSAQPATVPAPAQADDAVTAGSAQPVVQADDAGTGGSALPATVPASALAPVAGGNELNAAAGNDDTQELAAELIGRINVLKKTITDTTSQLAICKENSEQAIEHFNSIDKMFKDDPASKDNADLVTARRNAISAKGTATRRLNTAQATLEGAQAALSSLTKKRSAAVAGFDE